MTLETGLFSQVFPHPLQLEPQWHMSFARTQLPGAQIAQVFRFVDRLLRKFLFEQAVCRRIAVDRGWCGQHYWFGLPQGQGKGSKLSVCIVQIGKSHYKFTLVM